MEYFISPPRNQDVVSEYLQFQITAVQNRTLTLLNPKQFTDNVNIRQMPNSSNETLFE